MIGTKYKYGLVDMSYILYRNCFAVSRGKNVGEWTAGDVIRCTIQTLNKIPRDWGITVDKFILVYDKWDKEFGGYYTTYLLNGAYKDSRGDIEDAKGKANPLDTYMTREKYEAMKNDPDTDPDDLKVAYEKLYFNEQKYDAKWAMVKELKNFGVPSIGLDGWEYDNLAWLATGMLYSDEPNAKPSVIITKDSDLQYALSPQMDFFKLPTGGSAPTVITYADMYQNIPQELQGRLSLYEYKAYLDALGEGHNGMRKTRKDRVPALDAIKSILAGDYSVLDDVDLFNRQLSTFDISKFPRLNEAKRYVTELFGSTGRLGTLDEFRDFCKRYNMTISDDYFIQFISRFDPELFQK